MSRGMLAVVGAHLIWGFAPLYWVRVEEVSAINLVAHRAVWSLLLLLIALAALGKLGATLNQLRQPRVLATVVTSATAQACNWCLFVWAVTNDHATEASLGYFLLPLVNVAIGVLVLRERIDRAQVIAIVLAAAGVLLMLLESGGLPWVALGVSVSFATYGLVRKLVTIGALEGLAMETLLMAPAALLWLYWHDGGGFAQHGLFVDALLVGGGVVTIVPLLLYVAASHRLALTAMGLAFYIGPSIQFLVAVFVFEEPIRLLQLVSFTLVWLGLACIVADTLKRYRNLRSVASTTDH